MPRGAGPAMPTRTPRSRGAGRWGRVGRCGPGTHPLLPHRSNAVPSRVAPPPGARCHQNHSAGTNLYGKKKKCARGHRTPVPDCPQAGETVVSAPAAGGRRGARKRGAKAGGRAPGGGAGAPQPGAGVPEATAAPCGVGPGAPARQRAAMAVCHRASAPAGAGWRRARERAGGRRQWLGAWAGGPGPPRDHSRGSTPRRPVGPSRARAGVRRAAPAKAPARGLPLTRRRRP